MSGNLNHACPDASTSRAEARRRTGAISPTLAPMRLAMFRARTVRAAGRHVNGHRACAITVSARFTTLVALAAWQRSFGLTSTIAHRCSRRTGDVLRPFGEEHRLALVLELLRGEAAFGERALEELNVLLDVGRVDRVVRQGEELEVLAEARLREFLPGLVRDRLLGKGQSRNREQDERQSKHGVPFRRNQGDSLVQLPAALALSTVYLISGKVSAARRLFESALVVDPLTRSRSAC